MYISGSHAKRSPDCVFVKEMALSRTVRKDIHSLSLAGPRQLSFHWYEILAFVELKLEEKRLKHHLSESASTVPAPEGLISSASGKATSSESTKHREESFVTPREVSGATSVHAAPTVSSLEVDTTTTLGLSSNNEENNANPSEPPAQKTPAENSASRKRPGPTLESESSKKQKQIDPGYLLQCASYALEMLSHGGIRSHAFGIIIVDEKLQLLFYDRSLHVRSKVVNFLDNPALLITVVLSLARLQSKDWGHVPVMELNDDIYYHNPKQFDKQVPSPDVLQGARLNLANGLILEAQQILFQQHALIGRGTCVLQVTKSAPSSLDWTNKGRLVAKLCFSPQTRTSEWTILKRVFDMIKSDPERLGWIRNHIPVVLHHETIKWDETGVQGRLAKYLEGKNVPYEKRVLRILIMTELFPITQLTTTATLGHAIKDIFRCYRWLHDQAHVLHRDISLKNLMYRKKDGKAYGVLVDYDMAIIITPGHREPSSKQRTGTQPYMAYDLLRPSPPKHVYRHDLESLFYVMAVITTMYHKGKRIVDTEHPLADWFHVGMKHLRDMKYHFLGQTSPPTTAHFLNMASWILGLRMLFKDGYNARTDFEALVEEAKIACKDIPSFDEDTLGGEVDFDKFQKILDRDIGLPAERVLLDK
ncbi:hypothetical protein AMATHDRAFT_184632 [Amanita thiersii Skay4041]|uniref:Protein kinase domain-containing protein n=1 Tax=Amanita thiersii Skay4041 TaxID=703135 RepID=A0A2A9NC82_9AGAR|nr:hypothetical protein AMATHDRAFT_184632 [Amanita thiersii Skay4041]